MKTKSSRLTVTTKCSLQDFYKIKIAQILILGKQTLPHKIQET
jgi:hypothetical protein